MTYAMLACLLCRHFDSHARWATEAHPNLIAYERRVRERFYPEFNPATAVAS